MAKLTKRMKSLAATVTADKAYPLSDAISLVKTNAKAKFDETIEISMNLGIDPRHADQMVRGLVGLPNGTGKVLRVGVFARGPKAQEALDAGADVVGADDLAEKVQAGDIQFDRCIATPDMMALVGRLGKILGPRGRRRCGRRRRPRRPGSGRQDRFRPLHRDAGHDGPGGSSR